MIAPELAFDDQNLVDAVEALMACRVGSSGCPMKNIEVLIEGGKTRSLGAALRKQPQPWCAR
nr:hypothetical protein [Variovorax paradoxus]